MNTVIKSLLFFLSVLIVQKSLAQDCSFREKITYPNGTVGCIKDLNLPARDNTGFNLSSMINSQAGYVAISKQDNCKAIAYGGAFMGASSNPVLKEEAKIRTLNACQSLGCVCTLLLDDGSVKSDAFTILKAQDSSTINMNAVVSDKLENGPLQEFIDQKTKEQLHIKEQQRLALEIQLKEQVLLAQEAKLKEQERILAEQKAKEQLRLAEEFRIKEQQRLMTEASELKRLRAEAEESKRKQSELEEQLRIAKLQNQSMQSFQMTTVANRKALVIGNDSYKSVSTLVNAREDAKSIAASLLAVGYQVTLKLDLNEKEMKSALRLFSTQVQGGDEIMFFFAGHGVQLGATNYLLPTDIGGESEAQVKDEAIQLQRILDDMTERKAKFTLAMIDACRDNPFKSAGRNIGGRGLAPTTAATGQMVVFSAGSGQQALDRLGVDDKNKNGVFTRTFLKEIQNPGVSIDRIVKNVRNQVADLAKSVGHEQVPAIYDQVLGDFYFKK
jgi:hypothetical protein